MSKAADVLRRARELDEKFRGHGTSNARTTGWMPFQLADFVTLLTEAVTEAGGCTFLDIGCGPGSKSLVAQELFGLAPYGLEYDVELAFAAGAAGVEVEVGDALDFNGYGDYDVIWFNRVFRDPGAQRKLEAKVWRQARPGTVVLCAHLENPPPNWFPVFDDWEVRRGVWRKPGG